MIKLTPHENLVPDTRDGWVRGNPYHDLIFNYILAVKLIRAASQFFHLKKGSAVFSGYVLHGEGPFTIKLWHEDEVVRSLALIDLGLEGILNVELREEFPEAVGWDLVGSLAPGPARRIAATAR